VEAATLWHWGACAAHCAPLSHSPWIHQCCQVFLEWQNSCQCSSPKHVFQHTAYTTLWVKKNMTPTFVETFTKYWPTFKILSLVHCEKFAIKWLLIIPPHIKCVTALPCIVTKYETYQTKQHTHSDDDEDSLSTDFCWDRDATSEKTKTAGLQLELDASNSDMQAT